MTPTKAAEDVLVELVRRLQFLAKTEPCRNIGAVHEAADAITTLLERERRLRGALEPLALLAGDTNMNDPLSKWFTVGQLWEARAALTREGE